MRDGGGNESFPEIATHPSHNKRVEPCSSFAPKTHISFAFQHRACSSSKLFVINADSHSPCLRDDQPLTHHNGKHRHVCATRQLSPGCPVCSAEVRRQK